jgi:Tfp pilus assembly protein PilO
MNPGLGTAAVARRALHEHRWVVIPLAILLLANLLVYAFVIYPLAERVGSVSARTRDAEAELTAARAERAQAEDTLTGTTRASEELETFYREILPPDLSSARRLAYPRLDQLARLAALQPGEATAEEQRDRDHTLTRLRIEMTLAGTYQGIRRFIHQLEQASEFVVLEGITLSQDATRDGLLTVRLELSTYFRDPVR